MLESNADAMAIERCSRIEGSLQIVWGVTELPPLPCLREVGNQLFAEGIFIPDLSALSNLERIEGGLEIYQTGLTTLGLENLVFTGFFALAENGQMVTLGVPSLEVIENGIDVTDNAMLPTCELQTLAGEVAAPGASVYYVGNAEDGCPSTPG